MDAPANIGENAATSASATIVRDTPMLRQYLEMKEQAPDCVLFFRMGDFYEVFFEDAVLCSKLLSIQLTSRDKNHPDPIPMAGVPHRAVESYIAQMIEHGYKVAVCDQIEDPRAAKGLVKRAITRIETPAMFTSPDYLPAKDNRYLAALCLVGGMAGLAHLDLASGEFRAASVEPGPPLIDELARLEPAELVLAESQRDHPALAGLTQAGVEAARSNFAGRPPTPAQARQILGERFPGGAEAADNPALAAAAMAWQTLVATRRRQPEHIEPLGLYEVGGHMVLDATARRNLELYKSIAGGGRNGSLLQAVDRTLSPMGGRLLKQWLGFPLLEMERVEARHQAVDELTQDLAAREGLRQALEAMPDVPRLVGRASLGQAGPRELAGLRQALRALPEVRRRLAGFVAPLLRRAAESLEGLEPLAVELERALAESPPQALGDGGVIAEGFDQELDQLRQLGGQGKDWIAALQASLRAETGIGSLKIGFNRVFGYYIEVTTAHQAKVPEHFIRKQTLATAERYFTPELKEKEAAVLGAEEKALELERRLFDELRALVAAWSGRLMDCGRALAMVDVLAAWADLAVSQDYVRPLMSQNGALCIEQGRHPVVERMLAAGEFVPNDVLLDDGAQQVIIITGPNMAGKSTILRQVALICLLAQAGSFVPAARAELPLVDRVFTRVGAMDDLARGRSTFMVEMTETAQILKNATPRSLVVLDEVGRGTSTFDGLSLAWAVAEALHDLQGRGVKTLFATHYHELTELADKLPRVRNYNVAVREHRGEVVFLRRLAPGGVSRSYGLQVARLAGLPEDVLRRAREVLARLEGEQGRATAPPAKAQGAAQLPLFAAAEHPALARLRGLDPERMTPLEALAALDELRRLVD